MPAHVAPFGSWTSPITAATVSRSAIRLVGCALSGTRRFWLEGRPSEGGRHVVVAADPGAAPQDAIPEGFNVRTRVHEYGGGAFLVHGEAIFFSNDADGRVYRQTLHRQPVDGVLRDGAPVALTPEPESPRALRYADFVIDEARGRLIAVREDHRGEGEAVNTLVAIPLAGGESSVLAEGRDFYGAPRLSPDGGRLCFLAWDHPELPFLASELFEAQVADDGRLTAATRIDGEARASIVQPGYSPAGLLTYVSDREGHYDLYQVRDGQPERRLALGADLAPPLWRLGSRSHVFLDETHLVMSRCEAGAWRLMTVDLEGGETQTVDLPYSIFVSLQVDGDRLLCIAGGPQHPARVVSLSLTGGEEDVLQESLSLDVDAGWLSVPQAITFPTEGGAEAHAFYYPPTNPDHEGPEGARPPLIVKAHGGPTSAASTSLDPRIQFWTSRGFAVVDVNYRGSTGYGRAYRDALQHRWGIVDVDDCIAAAQHLVAQGKVDPEALLITGGSAGGYTTLASLAFRDVFRAGASHYGVSDLAALMADTHKFESRYDVYLIAPDASGDRADPAVMKERSPLYSADKLNCPVIFIQGLEDRVVPPNQAERMVQILEEKGIPVAYVAFEGEQHGFLKAENITRALETELYFYAAVLGFPLADEIEPVTILNLPEDQHPARR